MSGAQTLADELHTEIKCILQTNKRGFIAYSRDILIKHVENIEYLLNNSTIATES